jgi:hypothetical protein
VATQIFTALLENGALEQGARMSAMDNATRNAGEMIDKLTIEYNRSRQAVITNELIEIISGAEALYEPETRNMANAKGKSPRSSAPSSTCSSTTTCPKS